MRGVLLGVSVWLGLATVTLVEAQDAGRGPTGPLPPPGYGTLTQNDVSLRIRTTDIDLRFIPLDPRVTTLLAKDSWESLHSLVESRRGSIDSVSRAAGVSHAGLALVTFFSQRANARFDPQTLTLVFRNRVFQPLGIVPFTPRFSTQQLNVREQVSAIYLFEEDLPVNDSFTISYAGLSSDDWQSRQTVLDRERARIASRVRTIPHDSTGRDSAR
jgi:hypothetical protein